MTIPLTIQRFFQNSGGLNSTSSLTNLSPNESPDLQNVYFDEDGAITKRGGYVKLNTVAINGDVTGMYFYRLRNGTDYAVATAGAKLYKMDSLDGTWDDITDSTITLTPGTNGVNHVDFCIVANKLIGTNGVNAPFKWTGSSTADVLTITNFTYAKYCKNYQNYLFVAYTTETTVAYPLRVRFSNLGDPETWTAADTFDIPADKGDRITGMFTLFGYLYITCEYSIWRVTGDAPDNFVVDQVSPDTGCVSNKSIVTIDTFAFFAGKRNFYMFNGATLTRIGDKITTTISNLNTARFPWIVGGHFRDYDQIWWAVSSSGQSENDQVLVYDYSAQAWTLYDGINVNAMCPFLDSSNDEYFYTGDYDGYTYTQDSGDADSDSAINAYYWTAPIYMQGQEMTKSFRHAYIVTKQSGSYNLTVDYKIDFGVLTGSTTISLALTNTSSLWGVMVWGTDTWGGAQSISQRVNMIGVGRYLQLKFSNASANEPFTVQGFIVCARTHRGLR